MLYCLALGSLFLTLGITPLDAKQAALHQPVCLIPNGQTIDRDELPADTLREGWMAGVPSSKRVSMVSIPATHDAGTALGQYGWSRCQVLTIPAQLAVGVRGFDVRLARVKDRLVVFHHDEYQKVSFKEILNAFDAFLTKHPSEFIVMRVREETGPILATDSFENQFAAAIAPHQHLFYKAKSRTEIPTVGELRGKILVLDNYGKLPDAVAYENSTMSVQDDYDINDMGKKYAEIVAKFEDALHQTDPGVWNINYTSSCSILVDQLQNAQAVNAKVLDYLRGKRGNLGLVLMNFPSVDVIHEIIASNH